MSTIVNARDVLLQGTTPRLLPALLPGNLTVATSNVIGYPDFYSSVRSIEIGTTNQVFVQTTIAGVTPASIVLTAKLNNILGAVTWSIVSGTATYTTGSNTLTITNSGMTSVAVVIQASVTSGGITYTDKMTVVKVVEGSATVTGFLTNETSAVAALAEGNVLSYGYSSGTFKVFSGSTDVTGTAVTYSVVSSTSVSATIATTGIYKIDSLVADTGSFVVRAVYAGTTIDKTYTVTKSKSTFNGNTGVRGTVNIAKSIAGSVWSDAEANLAISNAGYGTPMTRDIVTLYNTSTSYSESKFYNVSVWASLDAYINGNLLVTGTVVADKIATNAITADKVNAGAITSGKISVGSLSALSANLGTITSADVRITGSGAFRSADKEWGDGSSGWVMSRGVDGATKFDVQTGVSRIWSSSGNDCGIQFPGITMTNGGLTINQLEVINTDGIVADGVTKVDITTSATMSNVPFAVTRSSKVLIICKTRTSFHTDFGGYATGFRVLDASGVLLAESRNQASDSTLFGTDSIAMFLSSGTYYISRLVEAGAIGSSTGELTTTYVLKVMK